MSDAQMVELLRCYICPTTLRTHPLYKETVAKYCPKHGDYFIRRLRNEIPTIVFRPFDSPLTREVLDFKTTAEIPVVIKTVEFLRGVRIVPAESIPKIPYPEFIRPGHPGRKIRCDQTGDIFNSLKEAARAMGLQQSALSKHISGNTPYVKGYSFTHLDLLDEPEPFVKKEFGPVRNGFTIRCDQTSVVFKSVLIAAKAIGANPDRLYEHLKDRSKRPHVKNFTFTKIIC